MCPLAEYHNAHQWSRRFGSGHPEYPTLPVSIIGPIIPALESALVDHVSFVDLVSEALIVIQPT